MRLASLLFILCMVLSCKERPSCEVTKTYSELVGDGLAELFSCKNKTRIALDIQTKVEELNLCTNPDLTQTGIIASVVCKPVSVFVTGLVVNATLPKRWECTGGVPGSALEHYIYNACAALPF